MGDHETRAKPSRMYYHEETWDFNSVTNTWTVGNAMQRVPIRRRWGMQITLLQDAKKEGDCIQFIIEGCLGVGIWQANRAQAANVPVDVEFSVPDDVDWRTVRLAPAGGPILQIEGEEMVVSGTVLEIDEGVFVIRIANGLLIVSTIDDRSSIEVGDSVSFNVPTVELFPTNI
jgi:hypothetical protein